MKIGIVLHQYGEHKPAGLARIISELTQEFILRDQKNEYIIFLKSSPKTPPAFPGSNWKLEILGGGIFWFDRLRRKERCDVYIFNTPALPLYWKPSYSIVIALDFAYWYFRPARLKSFILTYITYWYHRRSLKKADKIIAISKATEEDIYKLFPGIAEGKTKTIYFGFRSIASIPASPIAGLPERFFLFVGVWKERKNIWRVVRAFDLFLKIHPEARLVMVGKGEGVYAEKINTYIRENDLEKQISIMGFVPDEALSYLYKHAEALIFPSFIEGFGFPILEAMDAGLAVITSNVSSLGEIAGDAALLVDPKSPEEIAKAMDHIYMNSELRKQLREKGFNRAKEFSWDRTVDLFMEVLKTKAIK